VSENKLLSNGLSWAMLDNQGHFKGDGHMPEDESAANHAAELETTSNDFISELPDWEFWRQRGLCRLWQAVLLSKNIEPSIANLDDLQENDNVSYLDYRRKREILLVQYGVHPLLPRTEHVRAGQNPANHYISLLKLLEFAKDIGWRNLTEFERGLSRSTVILPSGETVDVEPELEDLAKGERYTLVRMGALLKILERCLQPDQLSNKMKFLSGKNLNLSALGREIESEIALAANAKKTATVSRFKDEANRKQLAAAEKALDNFF
jgi:hypothetical protein